MNDLATPVTPAEPSRSASAVFRPVAREEEAEQTALRARLDPTGEYQFRDFFTLLKPDFNPKGGDVGRWLKNLEAEGSLIRHGDLYRSTLALPEVEGRVEWHPRGHAVLHLDDGGTLFLPRNEAGKVLDQEVVRVKRVPGAWRSEEATPSDDEGLVMAVLKTGPCPTVGENLGSARPGWIGEVRVCEPMIQNTVRLSDRHVPRFVDKNDLETVATPGTLLAGQLRRSGPFDRRYPLKAWFDVRRIVGRWEDPGIETRLALEWMQADERFSGAALAEAHRMAERPIADIAAEPGRQDLRHVPVVTIDGPSTKDFDDAIGAETLSDGRIRVWIAIADVSTYVQPHGMLDRTAQTRTTSVYLPHRTIPMLPDVLSTGVCSLNPNVDRAAMVCEVIVTPAGEVDHVEFYPATVRSHARLMYHEVDQFARRESLPIEHLGPMPDGSSDAPQWDAKINESLVQAFRAAESLRALRNPAAFERRSEVVPVLGEHDKAVRLRVIDDATPSNKLVEEFMLLANREAARFLHDNGATAVLFRNQAAPEAGQERLKSAEYATVNTGHHSLGDAFYTHFTSPIRRYPDLMAHRAVKQALGVSRDAVPSLEQTQTLAAHCTEQQRLAKSAGHKAKQWLVLEYAQTLVQKPEPAEILMDKGLGWVVRGTESHLEGYLRKPLDQDEAKMLEQQGLWMKVDRVDLHGERALLKAIPQPAPNVAPIVSDEEALSEVLALTSRTAPSFGGRRG